MKKFEIGKRYITRFICDADSTFWMEVTKRTEKTITYTEEGETKEKTRKIHIDPYCDEEYIKTANYSMAPMFHAGRLLKEEEI